mmetsp:Transcript_40074/g.60678  ORF Transcript_40074/g.60678 Transcript_40074/m.60678 type:complete len:289 (+) Transcript_40074:147-1013(+)
MAANTTPIPLNTEEEAAVLAAAAVTSAESDQKAADEANAPPLHLHAMRIPARLQGSITKTQPRSRSSSRSRPNSRSTSPVPNNKSLSGGGSGMGTPTPSGEALSDCAITSVSSASSFDGNASERSINTDNLDPDIFTDQKGFEDIECPPKEIGASLGHFVLPPLNERLSDETLEDCHAFSDVVITKNNSRPSSVCGGSLVGNESILLETLDECFEEDEEDEEENDPETTATKSSTSATTKNTIFRPLKKTVETQDEEQELADDLIERLDHIQVTNPTTTASGEEQGAR